MTSESAPAEDLRTDVGALFGALWARALRMVLATALLVVLTFIVLQFVPRQFESTARLAVAPLPAAAGSAPDSAATEALLSGQVALIRSRDTLMAVVDELNLRSSPEFNGSSPNALAALLALVGHPPAAADIDGTVLQNLDDRLSVVREPDGPRIAIVVRSADAQLAARIANTLAAEAVKRQGGPSQSGASADLQQQIASQRQKVREADSKLADFKAQNGIPATTATTASGQQPADIGRQLAEAQATKAAAQQHADLIRSLLKAGQPVDGVEEVQGSAVVQALIQNRATLQATLAEKRAIFLPAHPTIKGLNAQIAQIDKQIAAEAQRIADGLDAQAGVQDHLIASLTADQQKAQAASSAQISDGATLDGLTRDAKAQHDALDALLQQSQDVAGQATAGSPPGVYIVAQATPAAAPASPRTTLILAAVAIVSLLLQAGWAVIGALLGGPALNDRNVVRPAVREPQPEDGEAAGHEIAAFGRHSEGADDAPPDEELDLADMPEPDYVDEGDGASASAAYEAAAAPPRDTREVIATPDQRHRAMAASELALSNLSADIALGRARMVFLAGVSDGRDAAVVADTLVADALGKGLSVCRVDAGSGRPSVAPGISDLCAEEAGFGDVVHKVREGLAEVPWGHLTVLDRRSMRGATLVEALADIYEVVIVTAGKLGMMSNLPLFAGLPGRLMLVRRDPIPDAGAEDLIADATQFGFGVTQSIMLPEAQSEVA